MGNVNKRRTVHLEELIDAAKCAASQHGLLPKDWQEVLDWCGGATSRETPKHAKEERLSVGIKKLTDFCDDTDHINTSP